MLQENLDSHYESPDSPGTHCILNNNYDENDILHGIFALVSNPRGGVTRVPICSKS